MPKYVYEKIEKHECYRIQFSFIRITWCALCSLFEKFLFLYSRLTENMNISVTLFVQWITPNRGSDHADMTIFRLRNILPIDHDINLLLLGFRNTAQKSMPGLEPSRLSSSLVISSCSQATLPLLKFRRSWMPWTKLGRIWKGKFWFCDWLFKNRQLLEPPTKLPRKKLVHTKSYFSSCRHWTLLL